MGGRQLFCLLEDGTWLGYIAEGEVFLDGTGIDITPESAMGEQRLEFRPEEESAVVQDSVVKRLDPKAVAGEKQRFAVAVPQGKGEHAAKAVDTRCAPGFPSVDDDFGIATSVEDMTEHLQLWNEFLIIVDFPVEDDADRLILVIERLLAGGQIDDREPAVAEADARFDMQATFVRAAMKLRFVHAVENRAIYVAFATGIEYSGDAAHLLLLLVHADTPARPSNLS